MNCHGARKTVSIAIGKTEFVKIAAQLCTIIYYPSPLFLEEA